MTWERALEADARLAAKNAVLIRAALRQSFDPERAFLGYRNTTPDENLTLPQQRVRSRSWAIMNIRPNLEPLREVLLRIWAEAYALGDTAAREAIAEAKEAQKADTAIGVDWSKWKPGDAAAAILLKPPKAFQRLLTNAGITLKGFSDTTLTDIGNAIGEAIELGLDAKTSAKNIMNHVANPARALSIAITEQNRAISTATQNRYLESGIEKNEWLVFQPCDICAKNAGQIVSIGAPFPSGDTQPPAHPHCRCALAPVVPDFDDPANTAGSITEPVLTPSGEITQTNPEDYRGYHRAPSRTDDVGGPATDVETGLMPDFYTRPDIYTTGMPEADRESVAVLLSIKDKPEAMVTIYRAVPEGVNQINPGDWVTLSPSYAETHLLSNLEGGRVISARIPAKDLWFDANSINEFGYDPIDKRTITVSFAGRNIESEFNEVFATDAVGRFKNSAVGDEILQMNIKDETSGGTAGDNFLKKVVQMQGFDGKPSVVETIDDVKSLAKTTPGKVLYRGIADFSKPVADAGGIIPLRPTVTYSADKAINDFIDGDYRAGWGVFGSGTYTSERYSEATGYALSTDDGAVGSGKVMAMFLPDSALMPSKEEVAELRSLVLSQDYKGDRNIGRILAARGYQAYDVGLIDEDKKGIYVILDRTAVTVSKERKNM